MQESSAARVHILRRRYWPVSASSHTRCTANAPSNISSATTGAGGGATARSCYSTGSISWLRSGSHGSSHRNDTCGSNVFVYLEFGSGSCLLGSAGVMRANRRSTSNSNRTTGTTRRHSSYCPSRHHTRLLSAFTVERKRGANGRLSFRHSHHQWRQFFSADPHPHYDVFMPRPVRKPNSTDGTMVSLVTGSSKYVCSRMHVCAANQRCNHARRASREPERGLPGRAGRSALATTQPR